MVPEVYLRISLQCVTLARKHINQIFRASALQNVIFWGRPLKQPDCGDIATWSPQTGFWMKFWMKSVQRLSPIGTGRLWPAYRPKILDRFHPEFHPKTGPRTLGCSTSAVTGFRMATPKWNILQIRSSKCFIFGFARQSCALERYARKCASEHFLDGILDQMIQNSIQKMGPKSAWKPVLQLQAVTVSQRGRFEGRLQNGIFCKFAHLNFSFLRICVKVTRWREILNLRRPAPSFLEILSFQPANQALSDPYPFHKACKANP